MVGDTPRLPNDPFLAFAIISFFPFPFPSHKMETIPANPIVPHVASPCRGAGARGGSPAPSTAAVRLQPQRIAGLALQQIAWELDDAARNLADARAQLLAVAEQLDRTGDRFGARASLIEIQRAVAGAILLAEELEETEGEHRALVQRMKEVIRRCRMIFRAFRDRAEVVDDE